MDKDNNCKLDFLETFSKNNQKNPETGKTDYDMLDNAWTFVNEKGYVSAFMYR